jgi:hypothetical protein
MSLARRTFAALSGVLLLHLALQASGSLCAMQAASHDSVANAPRGDMQGMPPATSVATAVPAISDAAAAPVGECRGPIHGGGCGSPWAPAHCSATSACGIGAAIAVAVVMPISQRAIALRSASIRASDRPGAAAAARLTSPGEVRPLVASSRR